MTINNSAGGKGSSLRPKEVSDEEFDNQWETIFGKKKEPEQVKQEEKPGI